MRVERIEIFPVELPLVHPYRGTGHTEETSPDIYLKVSAAGGAFGYGSTAPRRYPTGETQRTTELILRELLAPSLLGHDARDIEGAHRVMDGLIQHNCAAKAAIDLALHDLVARAQGVPVHRLLGPQVRSAMPAFELITLVPPDEAADLAREAVGRGARSLKVKASRRFEEDLERVRAVRGAIPPGVLLTVDANSNWDRERAPARLAALADEGVALVEQPLPLTDISGLAEVSAASPVKIIADESATPLLIPELVRRRAAHVFNIKLNRLGGFLPALRYARMIGSAGLECLMGGVVQNLLLDAAGTQFFAAVPCVAYNEVGKSASWHREDACSGLPVEGGEVRVPEGPGLGLEVDEAYLRSRGRAL